MMRIETKDRLVLCDNYKKKRVENEYTHKTRISMVIWKHLLPIIILTSLMPSAVNLIVLTLLVKVNVFIWF